MQVTGSPGLAGTVALAGFTRLRGCARDMDRRRGRRGRATMRDLPCCLRAVTRREPTGCAASACGSHRPYWQRAWRPHPACSRPLAAVRRVLIIIMNPTRQRLGRVATYPRTAATTRYLSGPRNRAREVRAARLAGAPRAVMEVTGHEVPDLGRPSRPRVHGSTGPPVGCRRRSVSCLFVTFPGQWSRGVESGTGATTLRVSRLVSAYPARPSHRLLTRRSKRRAGQRLPRVRRPCRRGRSRARAGTQAARDARRTVAMGQRRARRG